MDKKNSKSYGMYLLPNLLTSSALFSGFYAIIASIKGNYVTAVIAIFIAMIFDALDGRVARLTNSQSYFGAEYDSLADVISFGLSPSLLAYQAELTNFGKIGWLIAFLYTAATALRLAKFNSQLINKDSDNNFFKGLPCPAAAAFLISFIWLMIDFNLSYNTVFGIILMVAMVLLSMLMLSNIRYLSFKVVNLHGKVPFFCIISIILSLIIVSIYPALVLFLIFFCYAFSGIIITCYHRCYRQRLAKK